MCLTAQLSIKTEFSDDLKIFDKNVVPDFGNPRHTTIVNLSFSMYSNIRYLKFYIYLLLCHSLIKNEK